MDQTSWCVFKNLLRIHVFLDAAARAVAAQSPEYVAEQTTTNATYNQLKNTKTEGVFPV